MTLAEIQEVRRVRSERITLDNAFYCRPRRRRLTIERCLEDYLDANAFDDKRSACYHCPQGCTNRNDFAK